MPLGDFVSSRICRATVAAALVCVSSIASAGVTSRTNQYKFLVEGTTAAGLVRYMNGHAISGDHGSAYANIRPTYDLSLKTKQSGGGMCRPAQVNVHVTFDLTLPVAASPGAMGKSTRRAWNAFVGFAAVHENHHKASYLGCAKAFVAQALRQTAPSCFSLQSELDQMLREMERSCEAKQRPFDQSQARVLPRLSLFSMAGYRRVR